MPALGLILTFLKNYWIYIAVAGVIFFLVEKWNIMESTITKDKTEISQLHTQNDALTKQAAEIQVNVANQDVGSQQKIVVTTRQTQTKEKMNNVQVKLIDKPFTDPGLSSRASILRQHQDSTYPGS